MIPKTDFVYAYIIFLLVAVAYRLKTAFVKVEGKKRRQLFRPFLKLLVGGYFAVIIGAFIEFIFIKTEISLVILFIGVVLFISSIILRHKAIRALCDEWSLGIEISTQQRLVTDGIYKSISHPYHFSVILELAGFCLISNAYNSLILLILVQIPLIIVRILLEEKVLKRKFGEHYSNYLIRL